MTEVVKLDAICLAACYLNLSLRAVAKGKIISELTFCLVIHIKLLFDFIRSLWLPLWQMCGLPVS